MKRKRRIYILFTIVLLIIPVATLACSLTDIFAANVPEPTQPSEEVVQTETPAPPTATTDFAAETAAAETALAQSASETQNAQATLDSGGVSATQTAVYPFEVQLYGLGLDPKLGSFTMIYPTVSMETSGYQLYSYAEEYAGSQVGDFAVSADITWDSRYGDAGCGFTARSDGAKEKPTQYIMMATRGASGHLTFDSMYKGLISNSTDFFPKTYDGKFSVLPGSTNRLSLVGRGNRFELYSNGIRLGAVSPNDPPPAPVFPPAPEPPADTNDKDAMAEYKKDLEEYNKLRKTLKDKYDTLIARYKTAELDYPLGYVYLTLYTASGSASCQFNNAWLWAANAP